MSDTHIKIWDEVSSLIDEGELDNANYHLYESLLNLLIEDEITTCDNLLKYVMDKDLSTTMLVHFLNPLSVKKLELSNWDEFVDKATKEFKEKRGDKIAEELLKVIL